MTIGEKLRSKNNKELGEFLEGLMPAEDIRFWLDGKTWEDWLGTEAYDGKKDQPSP